MLIFLLLILTSNCLGEPCWRQENDKGPVCMCNNTYCDTVPAIGDLDKSTLKIYYTSTSDPGFNVKETTFVADLDPNVFTVNINDDTHQKIIGFGAGFTDSTGINLKHLDDAAQQKLLESYFGENGIEFTLLRVPIGGNEFSTKTYTLDDHTFDDSLTYFILQYEDFVYKIPFINQAQIIRKDNLKLIASSWTAPTWMKTPSVWTGGSMLKKEYYQTFAQYHARFFEEYTRNNISFWGITTGNEPFSGFIPYERNPSMGWAANEQANWLTKHLAPTLKNSEAYYSDLKILIFDDGLFPMPYIVPFFLENDTILQNVDGVATHTNWDQNMAANIRKLGMTDKKDIFRLSTQASHAGPSIGNWDYAEDYINNIIEVLTEYDYAGWMEANLALDTGGGNNYIAERSDAPILVDPFHGTFVKQPTFYAIGHFSKFVVPDSMRLGISQKDNTIKSTAFLRPDGLKAVVLYNHNDQIVNVQIQDNGRYSSVLDLAPKSINTIVYQA